VPWPVTREYVTAAEQALQVRFPAAFVAIMLRRNGGEVSFDGDSWQLHPFWDQSDMKRTSRTCNDIVRETRRLRELEWFPADAVAIAVSGDGDRLVLRPTAETPGELGSDVYLWQFHGGELQKIVDSPFELWE